MGYKKLLLLFLLLWQGLFLFAQKRPEWLNWYFGYKAGIDFHGAAPVAVAGKTNTSEGCAVASSPSGDLLFYTDGVTIWNKNHLPMKNGTGLLGNSSSTQSALILAVTKDKYFVFTADAIPGLKGYNYSEVDMSAEGGLGAVVPGRKNIPIFKPGTERMLLTKSDDSLSYWFITRLPNSNVFKSYRVNSQGLDTNAAVISNCTQINVNVGDWGNMAVSPKGDKIAVVYAQNKNVVLYDFDNKSGKLSGSKIINNIFASSTSTNDYYSVIFSPNSRYLYVAGYGKNLKQVDTSLPLASMGMNALKLTEKDLINLGTLQYSPDGKSIYLARSGYSFVSSIPFPDLAAPACGFIDTAIWLGSRCALGLPAFVSGYLSWNPDFVPQDQCQGDSNFFEFKPGSFIPDSISWDFGDAQTKIYYAPYKSLTHYYTQAGTYLVKMRVHHAGKSFVVSHLVESWQKPKAELGDDTSICRESFVPFNLVAAVSPGTYSWQDGSKGNSYNIAGPGTYWVEVKNGSCINRDSIKVSLDSALFKVDLGPDTSYCAGDSVVLDATYPGASYRWQNQQNQQTYTATKSGMYSVAVKLPGLLCPAYDEVRLDFKPLPKLELGPDQVLCPDEVLWIDQRNKGYDELKWQDGSKDSLYQVKGAGLYTLQAWSAGCSSTDSLQVRQMKKSDLGLQKLYTSCEYETVEIDVSAVKGTLTWADAGQAKKRSLNKPGWYQYTYTDSGCTEIDSFYVKHLFAPEHVLPADTTICPGESLWLKAASADTYLWQDGTTGPLFKVTGPGQYAVMMQNSCGTAADSINVWDCSCVMHVPSAFSPNGDGLNEQFKPVGCEPEFYRLRIYNRWGEKLFESNDFNIGWNGFYKERPVTDNVLVWIIEYASNTKSKSLNKMMKGTLSILQ